ncbi:MAG: pilus assembly protein, partial [Gallionellaceae bacterium]|nr:pilus assembly protein [Gallionellaceae bacterium]
MKFRNSPTNRQRGAAAVEFALVFILFFMVMYGAIAYGVVFAIKHSMTQAASEGARAALQDVTGGMPAREALALATAANALNWLGTNAPTPVVSLDCTPTEPRFTCLKVAITYDYAANPIIPPLPGLGVVLP